MSFEGDLNLRNGGMKALMLSQKFASWFYQTQGGYPVAVSTYTKNHRNCMAANECTQQTGSF
jgi:hypothetical protein